MALKESKMDLHSCIISITLCTCTEGVNQVYAQTAIVQSGRSKSMTIVPKIDALHPHHTKIIKAIVNSQPLKQSDNWEQPQILGQMHQNLVKNINITASKSHNHTSTYNSNTTLFAYILPIENQKQLPMHQGFICSIDSVRAFFKDI